MRDFRKSHTSGCPTSTQVALEGQECSASLSRSRLLHIALEADWKVIVANLWWKAPEICYPSQFAHWCNPHQEAWWIEAAMLRTVTLTQSSLAIPTKHLLYPWKINATILHSPKLPGTFQTTVSPISQWKLVHLSKVSAAPQQFREVVREPSLTFWISKLLGIHMHSFVRSATLPHLNPKWPRNERKKLNRSRAALPLTFCWLACLQLLLQFL